MASIEERLDREEWNPMPGDKVVGTITGIMVRTSKKGDPYPVLVIKDSDDVEHVVSCALMASEVIANRPQVGDRCGVKFVGPQPKSDGSGDTWDRYTIAFESDAPTAVDWNAMAKARGIVAPAANGHARPGTASAAGDPWTLADPGEAPF